MSFGYSVGDFLAAANLAWKISVALRGSKESSENIKSLINELEFTATALNQIGTALQNSGLQVSTKNVVNLGLSRCGVELKQLDEILKRYQDKTSNNTSDPAGWMNRCLGVFGGSGLQRSFKNLKWELCEKEGVSELGKSIRNNVTMITGILSASGVQTMTEMQGIITQQFKILNQLETRPPRDLIRTWSIDHKPLLLEDPLGRNIELPYEICSHSWGTFVKMLQLAFTDMPGSTWIDAGLFNIKTGSFELLTPGLWERRIAPNMRLVMSMVIKRRDRYRPAEYGAKPLECPFCGVEYRGYKPAKKEQVQCRKCLIWYSVTQMTEINKHYLSSRARITEIPDQTKENLENTSLDHELPIMVHRDDLRRFRRLDVRQILRVRGPSYVPRTWRGIRLSGDCNDWDSI